MTDVSRSRTLHASPVQVWAALSDYAAIATWAPNVSHASLTTEQSEGVGTTRRVQAGRVTLLERVVEWEPEHVLAYDISGLPSIVRSVQSTWALTARGDDTEVTLTSKIDTGPRPPQKLIARLVGKRLAKAADEMLDGLVAHLEASSS